MPSNLISQIVRSVPSTLNTANDALPGVSVSSGTGAAQYLGMVGSRVALGPDEVRGTNLLGGIYMYVKTKLAPAVNPAVGQLAFWDVTQTEDLYIVTSDAKPTTAIPSFVAGVFLNAITPGNFGWIQVAGRARVLFDSAITAAVAGNWVTAKISAAVPSTADVGAAAGVVTIPSYLGVAETLPVVSTISVVQLRLGWMQRH